MNKLRISLILSAIALLMTGIIGVAGAQSAPTVVVAQYQGTYQQGTCVLNVANTGSPGTPATGVELSSGSGQLWVQNNGVSDSLSGPTQMSVNVAYNDNGGGLSTYGGWYTDTSGQSDTSFSGWTGWVNGISTTWSVDGVSYFPLEAYSLFGEGAAYGSNSNGGVGPALASGGAYQPVDFSVTNDGSTLPVGIYAYQQIVLSASC